jgi:hypothetical protein
LVAKSHNESDLKGHQFAIPHEHVVKLASSNIRIFVRSVDCSNIADIILRHAADFWALQ